jgi:transcriptional regulator with XRE-family HTH domain
MENLPSTANFPSFGIFPHGLLWSSELRKEFFKFHPPMASPKLPNYLRASRKRLGLSQEEVAYLLGVQSGAKLSRYEGFNREPSLETALALELIYGKPAHDLFGGLSHKIEHDVAKRAKALLRKYRKKTRTPATSHKIETLAAIIANSEKNNESTNEK